MNEEELSPDPAERIYRDGMKFDLKQNESPSAAALARANFQQAASMGHRAAVRALAHMVYDGRGGERDQTKGLLLLWSAYRRGDEDAFEEFTDLLATYGEEATSEQHQRSASRLAKALEDTRNALARTGDFMYMLARERGQSQG